MRYAEWDMHEVVARKAAIVAQKHEDVFGAVLGEASATPTADRGTAGLIAERYSLVGADIRSRDELDAALAISKLDTRFDRSESRESHSLLHSPHARACAVCLFVGRIAGRGGEK